MHTGLDAFGILIAGCESPSPVNLAFLAKSGKKRFAGAEYTHLFC